MDRRFQVFVSSTFRDLQDERQQVMQALLELDCMPSGMELFPASDESKWTLITRVIDDCDYYLVIIGGRYGSVDADGISFTEREYDYAVKAKIPVLAFLHNDPDAIPAGRSELDRAAREKLDAFRAKAETRICKHWRTPEELGGVVSRSLIQMIKLQPREGWVRARFASSPEELQKLRSKIDDLTAKLEAARTEPPADALRMAQGAQVFRVRYKLTSGKERVVDLSWDSIFACLGPTMFDEASEVDLVKTLDNRISQEAGFQRWQVDVRDEDFQTIKVQLRALGLIQKSIRKRSLKDTGTYWALTPYGEHYATVLKAIPG
ncbi:MAG: DUF4062 domain-containing protein [Planctomycetes bacterium]|nr:DUF4062 domain-containing protein [Planctomycetota bacterium]